MISVITVVYNEIDTIERTIKSVIDSKTPDIEYIVIDGGSTDGTVDIIKKYDSSISAWISEEDGGIYDAMNKGIAFSSGEWISFMNGNDWYAENALAFICDYLSHNNVYILYGKVKKNNNGNIDGYIGISSKEYDLESIHFGNLYCHQGLFIKRELFDTVGYYDLKYPILADYKWLLEAHRMGINPTFVDEDIAFFTTGGVSSGDEVLRERSEIQSTYCRNHKYFGLELEKKRGLADFNLAYLNDKPFFKEFFRCFSEYYVWGIGDYGKKIYEILECNSIPIKGFIQSSKKTEIYRKRRVYSLEEMLKNRMINDGIGIFIATERYEQDIIESIKDIPCFNNKILTLHDLFIWAYDNATK